MAHLSITRFVDLLDLKFSDLWDISLLFFFEYVQNMLYVKKQSLICVQTCFLQQVVVSLLQVTEGQVILYQFTAWE